MFLHNIELDFTNEGAVQDLKCFAVNIASLLFSSATIVLSLSIILP